MSMMSIISEFIAKYSGAKLANKVGNELRNFIHHNHGCYYGKNVVIFDDLIIVKEDSIVRIITKNNDTSYKSVPIYETNILVRTHKMFGFDIGLSDGDIPQHDIFMDLRKLPYLFKRWIRWHSELIPRKHMLVYRNNGVLILSNNKIISSSHDRLVIRCTDGGKKHIQMWLYNDKFGYIYIYDDICYINYTHHHLESPAMYALTYDQLLAKFEK